MKWYVKKPIPVPALQWDGFNRKGVELFIGKSVSYDPTKKILVIDTYEGDMIASQGDYIIRGIEGEFYPCKPSVFEKSYEEVEDPRADEEKNRNSLKKIFGMNEL